MVCLENQIPAEVTYEEGIYAGYRYYNTFNVKTAYEFGYGLSYTKFSCGPVKLGSQTFDRKITASVTVTNTGNVAGKEVVELYLSAPSGKLDKPAEELKAFAKTFCFNQENHKSLPSPCIPVIWLLLIPDPRHG